MKEETRQFGLNRIMLPSLSHSFGGLFYVLWSVPYFRYVEEALTQILKRFYLLEVENYKLHKSLILTPDLFAVSRVVYYLDEKNEFQNEFLNDAISQFSQMNPTYRTHGSFDLFEALTDFLTSAHLNLQKPVTAAKNSSQEKSRQQAINSQYKSESPVRSIQSEWMDFERTEIQDSAFFSSICGVVENMMLCDLCGAEINSKENFISLNFKLLDLEQVRQVRRRFEEEGYKEGLVTRMKQSRAWNIFKLFSKKSNNEPLLTIRDYLCYLNLLQTQKTIHHCSYCKKQTPFIASKLLYQAPEVLIVGFFQSDDSSIGKSLHYRIDLEFDITPFVNKAQPKYDLLTVVTLESGLLGIRSEVVYTKGPQGGWLRIDQ